MFTKKVILGIDPGYGITGYGVISVEGATIKCIDYGVITTRAGEDFELRLKDLNKDLKSIIKKHKPDLIGIEDLFFAKNVKTAMKVSHARGVIILTAVQANIPIVEFTPVQVKQAISGYGKAEKGQVQQMVKTFLSLKEIPKPDDAADALAVAVCAANSLKLKNKSNNK